MWALIPAGRVIRHTIRCSSAEIAAKSKVDGLVGEIGPDNIENVEDRYLLLLGVKARKFRRLRKGGWAWEVTYLFQPLWLVETDIDTVDWHRLMLQ